ncbi:hypothetical protein PG988_008393 [Apiospora saccharicola]
MQNWYWWWLCEMDNGNGFDFGRDLVNKYEVLRKVERGRETKMSKFAQCKTASKQSNASE